MKLALVTTPPSVRSGIGDYTRHLVPYLREHVDLTVFVEDGLEGEELAGLPTRAAGSLLPREHDQLLFQLGNEISHGFMAPMVRELGGTVCLHDWVLFDMALSAWPALAEGGWRGRWLALREGGFDDLALYRKNREDRRGQNRKPREGWYPAEQGGRWSADVARIALPGDGAVRVRLRGEAGRRVRFTEATGAVLGELVLERAGELCELELAAAPGAELVVQTDGAGDARSDGRRLGCFIAEVARRGPDGWRALPLEAAGPVLRDIDLSRDRFGFSLNRSIVRFADGFLVHSVHLGRRIEEERNALTAIGVVHHGAQPRWTDGDRRAARTELGLAGWEGAFVLTSFGAVQAHKRVEVLLEALGRARADGHAGGRDVRLVLIGRLEPEVYDPRPTIARLGLEDAVRLTDHVPEERAWGLIEAGDLAVQLRGPSTGGTSGGVFQSLALGRAVIASRVDEQAELPESCVLRVGHGEREVEDLAALVLELAGDPDRLSALEQAARTFVRDECSWELVAERYAEALAMLPSPRSAKKRFVIDRIRQGLKDRAQRS